MEKRLVRSRKHKVFAGIAGGLGEYLDIDPIIIRVIFVLITIFHGIGVLIYIIMWIVIPEEPFDMSFAENSSKDENKFGNQFSEDFKQSANSVFDEAKLAAEQAKISAKSSNSRIILGAILILIGLLFLAERFFSFIDFEFVFAIGLIVVGLSLLFNFFKKSEKLS